VKDWGAGRPIVFAHGWPLNADSWDFHAAAMVDAGYRTIAYDRRGFGRSPQPADGYDYDTLADDLARIIDQRDLRDVTLVGFSMGGAEVVRYLARHGGERVRKLVLVGAAVPLLQGSRQSGRRRRDRVRRDEGRDQAGSSLDTFANRALRRDIARITVPTLLLHGTADAAVPVILARQAAGAIGNARLVEYQGVTHGLLVTERDRVAEELLEFARA
jgi:non-heme chloroperoxidase